MFRPEDYEEYENYVYDSCLERMREIISKKILKDEDIEELKGLIEYIETEHDRRYYDGREEWQ